MTDIFIVAVLIVSVISLVINFIILIRKNDNNQNYDNYFNDVNKKLDDVMSNINQQQSLIRQELNQNIQDSIQSLSKILVDNQMANQRISSENQILSSEKLEKSINEKQSVLQSLISNDMKSIDDNLRKFAIDNDRKFENIRNNIDSNINTIKNEIENRMKSSSNDNIQKLDDIQIEIDKQFINQMDKIQQLEIHIKEKQDNIQKTLNESLNNVESRLKTFSVESEQKLENIRGTVAGKLNEIQNDTSKSLDKMRDIVEEKMQKTLEDKMTKSFSLVNERLEQVYKGLGEMQNLAVNVGDLKKVLTNVKSRGIVGEIQLGAILEEILSPQQFDKNVKTKKGSDKIVEYAIKLPGDSDNIVYLPIDSKFPGDTYAKLRDAYEIGDTNLIEDCAKKLVSTLKSEARDIHDKYIDPPNTTEFAIMFLPFEGLYAEAVNRNMIEELQRDYKVNIAGPSTMASLLNSLQMGFKTLAVQKRSGEVWNVLGAVKTEFDKFADVLVKTQASLEKANKDLDSLVGVRTRQIQRKLKDVTEITDEETLRLLENI